MSSNANIQSTNLSAADELLLSIVIVTHNRRTDLVECIESLVVATKNIDNWELLVIDDCSTDDTASINLSELGVKTGRTITNKKKMMLVKNRNIGARLSCGKYILLVDDDNIVQSDMVDLLIDFAQRHPDYGMIGPAMWWIDPPSVALDHQHINFFTGRTIGEADKTPGEYLDSEGIPNIFMVPRHVFEECGYFDESLIQTYTEPDFAFQIQQNGGYGCCIVKKAYSLHKIYIKDNWTPRGLGGQFNQKGYCLLRNRSVIVRRYGRWYHKIIYVLMFSWIWPFAYSLIMLPHRRYDLFSVYFQGWVDGMIYFFTGRLVCNLKTKNRKEQITP